VIHVPTDPRLHYVFDALAWAAGAATGLVLYRWRLKEAAARVASVTGPGYFIALALGAVAGAWLAGSFNTLSSAVPELSHSVAGALAGAIVGVEIYKAVRRIHGSTGGVFVGPFAVGVVVGRWGCLFAGLPDRTYGTPTHLPWGVNLGDGIARHPVQIYESAAMALFLAVYVWGLAVRAPWALRRSFYVLAIWYGAQRFAWEFFKPYPSLIGPFNLFHLIGLGLIVYGSVAYGRDLARERAAEHGPQDRALPVPRSDHEPV
jgi:phosphatidylglycerol:prolipoprotein diacylglycerol transferase